MEKDSFKTLVIFRKWNDYGTVLALFPEEEHNGQLCMSYEHVGQHGGADYAHCIRSTKPASPSEYKALKKELESLGYDLDVRVKYVRSK